MNTKTALVIGGTGMLADFVVKLADSFNVVGVVDRSETKLQTLAARSQKIVPLQADYTDMTGFKASLDGFVGAHGKPSLIVAWVHSTSPDIPAFVTDYCAGDFYEITGSGGREATHLSRVHESEIAAKGISYHRIILGSMGDRWLTNAEISDGVRTAIQQRSLEHIVGS